MTEVASGTQIPAEALRVVFRRARGRRKGANAELARRWPAILLGLAVIPVYLSPSSGPLGAALHLPICVAIAALGLEVWRMSHDHAHESRVPDPQAHLAQA